MLAENYPDEKLIISQQSLNNASLNINTGHWTIFRRTSEFCPTKAASQRGTVVRREIKKLFT